MGLLTLKQGQEDYLKSHAIAASVSGLWNAHCSGIWGYDLHWHVPNINQCCDLGDKLFRSGFFPEGPGPFKRTAAYLVLGKLYPFYSIQVRAGLDPLSPDEKQAWLTRFLILSVPAILRQITIDIEGNTIPMNAWKGFPSLHFQLEFLTWLRWLETLEKHSTKLSIGEWDELQTARLSRMVMAGSLIIESVYYSSPSPISTGSCFKALNEEQRVDLYYDYGIPT